MARQFRDYEFNIGFIIIRDNEDGFIYVPDSKFEDYPFTPIGEWTIDGVARAIFDEIVGNSEIAYGNRFDEDGSAMITSPSRLRGVRVSRELWRYVSARRFWDYVAPTDAETTYSYSISTDNTSWRALADEGVPLSSTVTTTTSPTTRTVTRRRRPASSVYCDYCEGEFDSDELERVEDDHENEGHLCPSCYDEADICPECGRWIRCGCQSRRGRDGLLYCSEECLEEAGQEPAIHAYNYRPEFTFYGDPKDAYLGVELEVDRGNSPEALANDVIENERLYCMHDGSLDDGVEIASMPMTLDEHVGSDVWQFVREKALLRYFKSHDTRTCGLHVHVNRAFFGGTDKVRNAAYYKLMRLVQRFEEPIKLFSRRSSDRYAAFSARCWKKAEGTIFRKGEDIDHYYRDEKYMALNFTHSNTIEFRMFKGTLRVETILATLAFVDGLARAAKGRGEHWVEEVSWYGLCEWIVETCGNDRARECLVDYLAGRQLLGDAEAAGEE